MPRVVTPKPPTHLRPFAVPPSIPHPKPQRFCDFSLFQNANCSYNFWFIFQARDSWP